jgi:hypothetical protein
LKGVPRITLQILMLEFLRHKCLFAYSWNSAIIPSTTFTQKALVHERLSTVCAVEDTAA